MRLILSNDLESSESELYIYSELYYNKNKFKIDQTINLKLYKLNENLSRRHPFRRLWK